MGSQHKLKSKFYENVFLVRAVVSKWFMEGEKNNNSSKKRNSKKNIGQRKVGQGFDRKDCIISFHILFEALIHVQ